MIDKSFIMDIMLDNKNISEALVVENMLLNGTKYLFVIECKLAVCKNWESIIIGIPKNWEINLFDFYLTDNNKFIPHIEKNGKLCLLDLEGVFIIPDLKGLLNQCISQAKKVIEDGILGINKYDFIKEFDSYFRILKNVVCAHVEIPKDKMHSNIRFCEIGNNIYKPKKNTDNSMIYFVTQSNSCFSTLRFNLTQKMGIYFYINPDKYIYPPNIFDYKLDEFLNGLLSFVDPKDFYNLKNKCVDKLLLVFEIRQDEDATTTCGFVIQNGIFSKTDKVRIVSFDEIVPLSINRMDEEYISSRTNFSNNDISKKSILLVGCGSIGGYIFHNLVKSGCKKITLVDGDNMNYVNTNRHILGFESCHYSKVEALKIYAQKISPNLKIKSIFKRIEVAIDEVKLDDFDYIISAVGSHTVNSWLNKYFIDKKIDKTVFYVWNEAFDIGCHAARINIKDEGDYRDILLNVEDEILDLSSYIEKGQNLIRNYTGCNGSFSPYGSTLSIESSTLFMDLFKREIEGRNKDNVIHSKKGDDYYLKKEGYRTSNRYEQQKEKYLEVRISNLRKGDL